MENYRKSSDQQIEDYLVVPDNSVELVFTSSSFNRSFEKNERKNHTIKSHLSGLKTLPQQIKIDGDVLLSVRFKPYGLYMFSGIDLAETIDESILPSDFFGKDICTLEERLFETRSELEQVDLIQDFFMNKLHSIDKTRDAAFDYYVELILKSKGQVSIEELINHTNVSKKTIERKFTQNLGLTPKMYCRIVRIFHALKIPQSTDDTLKFSSIAYDNGFYDQTHFIKEVKRFTGMTPKKYFGIDRSIQESIFAQ